MRPIKPGVADAVLLEPDYHVKLVILTPDPPRWDRYNFQAGEGVDGLIVTHWRDFFSGPAAFRALGVPCVTISDAGQRFHAHCASADHRLGGRLAAQHLYARGHRRIAIITGPPHSSDSRRRVQGFLDYLRGRGVKIPAEWILHGEFHEEPTVPLAASFLRTYARKISAIFCCNDNMALGVLRACQWVGLSCPKDLSLIGYDNDPRGEHTRPPLTTVHVPLSDIARDATFRLLEHLKRQRSRASFFHPTTKPVTLVERQSVRRLIA